VAHRNFHHHIHSSSSPLNGDIWRLRESSYRPEALLVGVADEGREWRGEFLLRREALGLGIGLGVRLSLRPFDIRGVNILDSGVIGKG